MVLVEYKKKGKQAEGMRQGGLDGLPVRLQASSLKSTSCSTPIF